MPTPAHPAALGPLVEAARDGLPGLRRFPAPPEGARPAAVLVLVGEGPDGLDLLLIERAGTLRSHAGQPAFPGGAVDAGDAGPEAAALREAAEETGLDPSGVDVLATLPPLWLPPSGFAVTPVLGWWRAPSPVAVVDPGEVAGVHRVPVDLLADPATRVTTRHPSGWTGPAFDLVLDGHPLLVWGFTAGILDGLLDAAGWARPWDRSRRAELSPDVVRLAARGVEPLDEEAAGEDAPGRAAAHDHPTDGPTDDTPGEP